MGGIEAKDATPPSVSGWTVWRELMDDRRDDRAGRSCSRHSCSGGPDAFDRVLLCSPSGRLFRPIGGGPQDVWKQFPNGTGLGG